MGLKNNRFRHPFGNDLLKVERPGRYIGGELNMVVKNTDDLVRIALVYPELYELGMSNLGLSIIYHVLNSHPRAYAERAYLPWLDALQLMKSRNIPLFTLETYTPLNEMDIIGFSMHTELNYTNILLTLDLSGIPVESGDRDEKHPLIMLGGPTAFNPEPLKRIIDFFVIGEGEEVSTELIEPVLAWKNGELSRYEVLKELSNIEGIYVPSHTNGTVRRRMAMLERKFFPVKQLVPNVSIIHDRYTIEIMRGCTRGCRFCEGGMTYRPLRVRPVDEIISIAREGIKATGYDEIGLLAFTVSDYPDLIELIVRLKKALPHVNLSLPSLPVNALQPQLLDLLSDLSRFGITLAPETASPKLRGTINKNVPLEEIFSSIELAQKKRWPGVKLYFMIGLPGETDEDVEENIRFLQEVAKAAKRIRVRASFGPFVPRPHTPLQWAEQFPPDVVFERLKRIRKSLRRYRWLRISFHNPYQSILEGIFARGDEKLHDVLFEAYRIGAKFDDRTETFDFSIWERAFEKTGIDWRDYLRARSLDEPLPWDFIDTGIFKPYLKREYRRALGSKYTDDCMKTRCQGCGPWFKEKYPLCLTGLKPLYPNQIDSSVLKPAAQPIERYRYLMVYSLSPPASLIGHNDLMRLIIHGLRRSGIELRLSEGYVKRPKVSAGPSLMLGATGESELFGFETVKFYDPETLKAKIAAEMPEGVEIKRVLLLNSPFKWNSIVGSIYMVTTSDGKEVKIEVRHGGKKLSEWLKELDGVSVHRIGFIFEGEAPIPATAK